MGPPGLEGWIDDFFGPSLPVITESTPRAEGVPKRIEEAKGFQGECK